MSHQTLLSVNETKLGRTGAVAIWQNTDAVLFRLCFRQSRGN